MNIQNPIFSIVTPSYNQAAFLAETIESVLSQDGNFMIEYLVIDGGSTDKSIDIIKHYFDQVVSGNWELHCNGITMNWTSKPDNGQADAINQGMQRSTGDIFSYINSDDVYFPGAFQQIAQAFSTFPDADFIYGDGDVIDSQGNLQWEWLSRPYDHKLMNSYHFLWNDFTNYIMQQSTFWSKKAYKAIGGFDESFHYALDVEYWIRAGEAGLTLQHIPHKVGKFRLIPGTKSLSSLTAFWGDYLEIFRRYWGSRKMTIFFTYYYYNLAKQYDFDIDQVPIKDERVFNRWKKLPTTERQIIEKKAEQGLAISYLLDANHLLYRQPDMSLILFRKSISEKPYLWFHPFALLFYCRRLLGSGFAAKLDILGERIVRKYKWIRYSKRYHQKEKGTNERHRQA
jgi:glycosyltransferase involved in cell wall biosynthesis